jgi:hypothetical protein
LDQPKPKAHLSVKGANYGKKRAKKREERMVDTYIPLKY